MTTTANLCGKETTANKKAQKEKANRTGIGKINSKILIIFIHWIQECRIMSHYLGDARWRHQHSNMDETSTLCLCIPPSARISHIISRSRTQAHTHARPSHACLASVCLLFCSQTFIIKVLFWVALNSYHVFGLRSAFTMQHARNCKSFPRRNCVNKYFRSVKLIGKTNNSLFGRTVFYE